MTDMVGSGRPVLVFVVGPGAVGKMTVGTELAARTGLKLFHNHQTIDILLHYFAWGTAPFGRLLHEFRRRIIEEVAASDLPGLIFTYVWAFDQPEDHAEIEAYASIFRSRGDSVYYVELQAPQSVRLERNETAFRLAQKPSSATSRSLGGNCSRLTRDTNSTRVIDSRAVPITSASTTRTWRRKR